MRALFGLYMVSTALHGDSVGEKKHKQLSFFLCLCVLGVKGALRQVISLLTQTVNSSLGKKSLSLWSFLF